VASQQTWTAAASEVLGTAVSEVVPLARRKDSAPAYFAAGAVVFGAVVLLYGSGVIPGPMLLAYFLGALPMALLFQLGLDPAFAARTASGIELTSSTRLSPRPVGPPLGRLDPTVVSGPHGLMRNSFDIAGVRHLTPIWQRARFQQMLAAASVGGSAP
jgi:hypothetical protein